MSTLTIELPQALATKLESSRVPTTTLNEFLVGALEAWLHHRPSPAVEVDRTSWNGAFQGSAVEFVDKLIEDNQELFDELARR